MTTRSTHGSTPEKTLPLNFLAPLDSEVDTLKEIITLPLDIIFEIVEYILEAGVAACPPLLLFILGACLFFSDGCLPKLGGFLLIPISIIALLLWFLL